MGNLWVGILYRIHLVSKNNQIVHCLNFIINIITRRDIFPINCYKTVTGMGYRKDCHTET